MPQGFQLSSLQCCLPLSVWPLIYSPIQSEFRKITLIRNVAVKPLSRHGLMVFVFPCENHLSDTLICINFLISSHYLKPIFSSLFCPKETACLEKQGRCVSPLSFLLSYPVFSMVLCLCPRRLILSSALRIRSGGLWGEWMALRWS